MLAFITVAHVLLCVFMISVILLQPGKDAGMGAALGGGAATSAFGGRGAVTFLSKLTGVCAALFFLTSLGLSFVGMRGSVASMRPVATKKAAIPGAAPGASPANLTPAPAGDAPPVDVAPKSEGGPVNGAPVTSGPATTVPLTPAAPAPRTGPPAK